MCKLTVIPKSTGLCEHIAARWSPNNNTKRSGSKSNQCKHQTSLFAQPLLVMNWAVLPQWDEVILEVLPQYVATHTWIWSFKGRLTAEACWTHGAAESGTIGWAANSIRRGWRRVSRQPRFKSPLQPKWVVLLLWVTVQSPGIRTDILKEGWLSRRNIQQPRAHTSTELDSCYTDFI